MQQPNGSVNNGHCKVIASTDTHAAIEELLKAVFSVGSVLRRCNEDQLPLEQILETAMRRVGGWCKMAASVTVFVGQSRTSTDVNTEAETLRTVTRRQPVKIQQTEKT
jgi:hypothetical protein